MLLLIKLIGIDELIAVNKNETTHKSLDQLKHKGKVIVYSRKDFRSEYQKFRSEGYSIQEATKLAEDSSAKITKRLYKENDL